MNKHDPIPQELPANIEVEQALLGALLVNNVVYDQVGSFLEPEHFYEPLHRRMFAQAARMISTGKRCDPLTIKSFLPPDGVGELTMMEYLARLASGAVSIIGARSYAEVVHDLWIRREAIGTAQGFMDVAFDLDPSKDPLEALAPLEDQLVTLRAERIRGQSTVGAGRAYLDEMTAANQRGFIRGVPIVLPEIADVLSEPCFEAGNLYGLLSSSGEGKTSLTLQVIAYALGQGHPVHFQSYDQNRTQCIRQMVAQAYGIEARRQRNSKLLSEAEWAKCVEFANWVDRQPFEVVKCTDQGAAQLVGFARTFTKRHMTPARREANKVPLIVTDHIGSIKPEDRRADEGTKAKGINGILKAGAEQVDGAWLVLNQRNSKGMDRPNPRPISADLFGGDPAKQAYDALLFLYRPEKFKAERVKIAASDRDWKEISRVFGNEDISGVAEIGALKVRFGNPNIKREVRFEDRFTRYTSIEVPPAQQTMEGFDYP